MRSGLLRRGGHSPSRSRALWPPAASRSPGTFRGKDKDHEADDEAFIAKILEIIEKTAAQAEDNGSRQDGLWRPRGDRRRGRDRDPPPRRLADHPQLRRTAFKEALDFFRDVTGLNIILSRRATDLVGNDNTKVKLRLKDVQLRNALELLLTQTDAQLRYGIKNGVLQIGIAEDWKGRNLILDVIPIEDLLYRPPDFVAPEAGLDFLKQKWKR